MLATVRARTPLLWTGLVVVLCLVFAWLSLANVSGATVRDDGSCCDTEYVRGWWSLAPTLLVFPIYFIARLSWLHLPLAHCGTAGPRCPLRPSGSTRNRRHGPVGPGSDAYAVAGAVGEEH